MSQKYGFLIAFSTPLPSTPIAIVIRKTPESSRGKNLPNAGLEKTDIGEGFLHMCLSYLKGPLTAVAKAAKGRDVEFGRLPVDHSVIAQKLELVRDARAKEKTTKDAAALVKWSRATLY